MAVLGEKPMAVLGEKPMADLGRNRWPLTWLTAAGVEGAGLGGGRPVKSPPGATTIAHGVLVGWSAARLERRGRVWKSARELAVERERWAVTARCERGHTELLPDLAVWLKRSEPPVAVIAESGGRREDRQKMILEGWHDAILSGRYSDVHYHRSNASVAHWIRRLARKVRLAGPEFRAEAQLSAEEIAALSPATDDVDEPTVGKPQPSFGATPPRDEQVLAAPVRAPLTPAPVPVPPEPAAPPAPAAETPQATAERERRYREVFGLPEPTARRRWRR
jgi:hypothetical protein